MRSLPITLAAASALAACQPEPCPDGTGRLPAYDRCVLLLDAGANAGGSADAAGPADAGPCGGACGGDTPVCDEARGVCVQCTQSDESACSGEAPRCDSALQRCVACLDHADCTHPTAARCEAGACTGCTDHAQCEGIEGTEVCETESKTCVQCTAQHALACAPNVCDAATHTCTDRPAASKGLCQDCVADAECMPGQLCVPMTFDGTLVGQFCLFRKDAPEGPAHSCFNVLPFAETAPITSVDRTAATVCTLALTTCPALNQFRMQTCAVGDPPTAATDEDCGVAGLDDGLCRVRDGDTNRCTIPCLSNDDCRPGSTCNTGASRPYCEF